MDLGGNSASSCERAFRESETRGTPVIVHSPPPHNMQRHPAHHTYTQTHAHATPPAPICFRENNSESSRHLSKVTQRVSKIKI